MNPRFFHFPATRWPARAVLAVVLFATVTAGAVPRVGYVYPAGGKAGSAFGIEIGGQGLSEPTDVIVSGDGITARILDHNKLPPAAVIRDYADKLNAIRPELRELGEDSSLTPTAFHLKLDRLLEGAELDRKKVRQIAQYRHQRADPKRQENAQIAETVFVRFEISPDAEPGLRYLRLLTASGLSNPLRFVVGRLPEGNEPDTWSFDLPTYVGARSDSEVKTLTDESRTINPPGTVNGRIMPGDVDEFYFNANRGDQIVVAVQARNLIPYLADAVPGWFQAVVSLLDPDGKELAFADDYRFDPDPVLFYRIRRPGRHRIRIHDSIYRGREDFVYRITVGELPFLTSIYPLGGRAGSEIKLGLAGGNLPVRVIERFRLPDEAGLIQVEPPSDSLFTNSVPFHVDDVPESIEREPNDRIGAWNEIEMPGLINGLIQSPGDFDFYRVEAGGGRPMTAEIFARRLNSPLDASLTIYDSDGRQIAWNDDFANPSAGLTTHHADSRITFKPSGGGTCFIRVGDTQNRGGSAFAYRLKVTQGAPAYALRVTPSSLNAKPGGTARCTVHVVRLDEFEGPIRLSLKDAPEGFVLRNTTIPADEDNITVSISVPNGQTEKPVKIALQGTIDVDDSTPELVDVVPAEDMMQAFIWRHLVPVDALMVSIQGERNLESSR